MTISDVMKRTGLSRKAIYLYEDRGLLSPDKISRGIFRCREYSESDIERLITISRLRALDVPIDEICHIFNSDCRIDIVLQEHLVREKSRLCGADPFGQEYRGAAQKTAAQQPCAGF